VYIFNKSTIQTILEENKKIKIINLTSYWWIFTSYWCNFFGHNKLYMYKVFLNHLRSRFLSKKWHQCSIKLILFWFSCSLWVLLHIKPLNTITRIIQHKRSLIFMTLLKMNIIKNFFQSREDRGKLLYGISYIGLIFFFSCHSDKYFYEFLYVILMILYKFLV